MVNGRKQAWSLLQPLPDVPRQHALKLQLRDTRMVGTDAVPARQWATGTAGLSKRSSIRPAGQPFSRHPPRRPRQSVPRGMRCVSQQVLTFGNMHARWQEKPRSRAPAGVKPSTLYFRLRCSCRASTDSSGSHS